MDGRRRNEPCERRRQLGRLERQYKRYGPNQNKGRPKREVLLAAADGTVDPSTPIIWDYGKVTSAIAHPLDVKTLTVRGGRFTTIANQEDSKYSYFWRGFAVNRSNVRIEGVRHDVTGEDAESVRDAIDNIFDSTSGGLDGMMDAAEAMPGIDVGTDVKVLSL